MLDGIFKSYVIFLIFDVFFLLCFLVMWRFISHCLLNELLLVYLYEMWLMYVVSVFVVRSIFTEFMYIENKQYSGEYMTTTTPKLFTDYPTPFMFMNEVSLHVFLRWNRFVESTKSIPTCLQWFVASVEMILEFCTIIYTTQWNAS